MAKIVVQEFMTLDGVIEAPETWQFPYFSPDIAQANIEQIEQIDAQLLGRVTYEIFSASWPQRKNNEFGVADKLNAMPKFVVSSTLERADWHGTTILGGNAVAAVRQLKQTFKGVVAITGSAQLAQTLMQTDLIDEYHLQVYPVILGKGQRLFSDDGAKIGLRLVESKTYSGGVVQLTYETDPSA